MARYNNKRKQSLMMCMVCIMLFIFGVTAGISYAYFSDSKTASNTLNFGKLIISLTDSSGTTSETITLKGNASDTSTNKLALNDTITITGSVGLEDNSVDAYIRMKIKVYEKGTDNLIVSTFDDAFMEAMSKIVYKYTDTTSSEVEMQWFKIGNYIYLGNKIVAGDSFVYSSANTNDNKNVITLTKEMFPEELQGKSVDVRLVYQAIQSAGMKRVDGTTAVGTLTGYTESNAEIIAGIPVWKEIYFDALDENALGVYEATTHIGNAMDARGTFREGRKNLEGKYTHIELGEYPQTKYSGETSLLEETSETYTLIANESKARDNYVGTSTPYRIWKHKTTGDKYIRMDKVNSYDSSYTFSGGVTTIDGKTDVYFKLEPIVWEILGVTDADGNVTAGGYDGKTAGVKLLLSSVKILTAMQFAPSSISYTDDTNVIRSYLNGTFLSQAFTDDERDNIAETALVVGENEDATKTNDATTCKRVADGDETTTRHKVFLLSASDLLNKAYGYKTDTAYTSDETRIKYPTDYAGANYAYRPSTADNGGYWWSRSGGSSDNYVWYVSYDGYLTRCGPYYSCCGVVPALFLSIQ